MTRRPLWRRHPAIAAAAAVFLVGSVAFATTGGMEMIERLFVRMTVVGPDGQTQDLDLEMVPDEDGRAEVDVPFTGGQAKVSVDRSRGEDEFNVSVSLSGDDGDGQTISSVEVPDYRATVSSGGALLNSSIVQLILSSDGILEIALADGKSLAVRLDPQQADENGIFRQTVTQEDVEYEVVLEPLDSLRPVNTGGETTLILDLAGQADASR